MFGTGSTQPSPCFDRGLLRRQLELNCSGDTSNSIDTVASSSVFYRILGDPLSGPSAVDAVVAGCTYINPVFATPVKTIYHSQHPFLAQRVGEPYVCSFEQKVSRFLAACCYHRLPVRPGFAFLASPPTYWSKASPALPATNLGLYRIIMIGSSTSTCCIMRIRS